ARRGMTRRFPIVLTLVVLICQAILIGLGVWQLQRLKWKEGVLARRDALVAAAPVALEPKLAAGGDLDMTRVDATCPGLSPAPYEELYGVAQGQMVNRLVSPCPIKGAPYDAILVDRGYVLDTVSARPAIMEGDTYPSKVVGVLLATNAGKAPTATIEVDRL